jgi:hypothetical protein
MGVRAGLAVPILDPAREVGRDLDGLPGTLGRVDPLRVRVSDDSAALYFLVVDVNKGVGAGARASLDDKSRSAAVAVERVVRGVKGVGRFPAGVEAMLIRGSGSSVWAKRKRTKVDDGHVVDPVGAMRAMRGTGPVKPENRN